MINFTLYNVKSNDMLAADLSVGDTLVRLVDANQHSEYRKVEYTVTKILKTRLVIADAEGHEVRLVINTSSWSVKAGEITSYREGDKGYRATQYKLATKDDEAIIDRQIALQAERLEQQRVKSNAQMAIREITNDMYPSLESVESAIEKLQALAEQMRVHGA